MLLGEGSGWRRVVTGTCVFTHEVVEERYRQFSGAWAVTLASFGSYPIGLLCLLGVVARGWGGWLSTQGVEG